VLPVIAKAELPVQITWSVVKVLLPGKGKTVMVVATSELEQPFDVL
jgi:hypothetical protein